MKKGKENIGMLRFAVTIILGFMALTCEAMNIKGVVKDSKTGEEIIGAVIRVKDNPTQGTTTDMNGTFDLKVEHLPVTLYCTYVGYRAVEQKVDQSTGIITFTMAEEETNLNEVMVKAQAIKSGERGLMLSIKEASSMQSGISSQQIQKAQDKDASEVVKRIAGISLQDNRFVMVRGLAQRYNNVWLNGSAAPSSEADSRAFSFDIIPSSQIDNMLVVKSPSPEYPADFAGGMILLETKDVPLHNYVDITANAGVNTQTTFSDFLRGKGSKTDLLGFDNGFRSLNGGINGHLSYLDGSTEAVSLLGNGLNNDWRIRTMKALPEMTLGVNVGQRIALGTDGALLGVVAALNWGNSYSSFTNMTNNLFGVYDVANDHSNYLRHSTDNQYNQKSKLCGMLNLSYLSPKEMTRIQWKTIVNQLGHSRLITRNGVSAQSDNEESAEYYYSSRLTLNTQFDGRHHLTDGSTLNWVAGYAFSNRNMPDRRRYCIDDALQAGTMQLTNGNEINREWTYLTEHTLSGSADWKKQFTFGTFRPSLQIGGTGERRHRQYTTRNFIYNWDYSNNTLPANFRTMPIEQLMSESNYGITGLHLLEEVKMRNNYEGNNTLGAGFLSLTLPFGKLDVHGGLRYEYSQTELINNTRDYEVSHKSTNYTYNDLFPSVSLKYELNSRNQLRLAYGKSCNRPEFRELSSSVFYDFDLASDVQGNTDLKTCYIQNLEARYGFYPSDGEQIVVGAFYKYFDSPIEWTYTVAGGTDLVYSYENAKSADTYGLEMDVRLNLDRIGLRNFVWTFNGALIKSSVRFAEGSTHRNRPMQGQSPYLINTALYWNNDRHGLQAAVLYNRIGKRIVGVGRNVGSSGGEETANIPDSYEMPRNVIDLSLSKSIGKRWNVKLSVRDLLAEKVYYNQIDDVTMSDGTTKQITETTKSYRPGQTILIGASYKF